MTTVRILPEILSNQIAAGEVVERPASVVKELVENSIDANATQIIIEIVNGGKSLIRVSDNGIGLLRDDALLSIERYATSKIFNKEDLFSISTMGFRGEALPSIASVSKFILVTRTTDSDIGTKIDIAGGKILNVSDAGAPVGTMVEVKQLFFNTPARKKFLKSNTTETSHIADAVSGMALGNPHVQFRLFLNHKLQKSFSLSDDLFQRSVRILGRDVAGKLCPLEFADEFVRIQGYCSNPSVTRRSSSKIFLFVNNRLVYDRGLIAAIFQGYKGRIMKGNFPLGVFFVEIAFDQVDVNVHPSKKEIRFFNSKPVYQAMSETIDRALSCAQDNMTSYSQTPVFSLDTGEKKAVETFEFFDADVYPESISKIEQSIIEWQTPVIQNKPVENQTDSVQKQKEPACQQALPQPPGYPVPSVNPVKSVSPALKEKPVSFSATTKIIGQVMGTYILVETQEGIMLMDQHAAHERIVYEKLKRRYQLLKVQSQSLVVPETLDLNFKEADFLSGILEELKGLGVIIEPFGGTTFIIKAVPVIIDEKEIKHMIVDIIEKALVKKDRFSKDEWLEQCLILMACHSAIRANLKLNQTEMETLLADLEACENPCHCPHGRPIMIAWTKQQIEKLFKRVL
ncbi:DNA mismatch repair endonuclease MutL [Desulfobacula phenolica]|uniref:DNA mismatch repair protein MutL n=1 Tax=Desulfobacula phenolica TaxID=90732 RepID=A0A1H2HHT4_9BACT|nr:DNA mismatch repair endonuclease MutL [Desulfobacula phenolica]SDU31447.1 DNA mismatch repair protein MutL [Desulfobacula phenolica]